MVLNMNMNMNMNMNLDLDKDKDKDNDVEMEMEMELQRELELFDAVPDNSVQYLHQQLAQHAQQEASTTHPLALVMPCTATATEPRSIYASAATATAYALYVAQHVKAARVRKDLALIPLYDAVNDTQIAARTTLVSHEDGTSAHGTSAHLCDLLENVEDHLVVTVNAFATQVNHTHNEMEMAHAYIRHLEQQNATLREQLYMAEEDAAAARRHETWKQVLRDDRADSERLKYVERLGKARKVENALHFALEKERMIANELRIELRKAKQVVFQDDHYPHEQGPQSETDNSDDEHGSDLEDGHAHGCFASDCDVDDDEANDDDDDQDTDSEGSEENDMDEAQEQEEEDQARDANAMATQADREAQAPIEPLIGPHLEAVDLEDEVELKSEYDGDSDSDESNDDSDVDNDSDEEQDRADVGPAAPPPARVAFLGLPAREEPAPAPAWRLRRGTQPAMPRVSLLGRVAREEPAPAPAWRLRRGTQPAMPRVSLLGRVAREEPAPAPAWRLRRGTQPAMPRVSFLGREPPPAPPTVRQPEGRVFHAVAWC